MLLLLGSSLLLCGQFGQVVNYAPPTKLTVKRGVDADSKLKVEIRSGYHVNSNTPAEEYLIPLRLTWNAGSLESVSTIFPKPEQHKYSFSQKPLSVYTGSFEILTHFKAAANAAPGISTMTGKLRYQACNDNMCLPPKTLDVALQVEIAP